MRVQELDPKKRYFVILEGEFVTQDDIERLSQKLKDLSVNAVVLAGASVRGGETYFGLYCEQCGVWWVEPNGSRLVFYPAAEIANAHLQDRGWFRYGDVHLWKVQEYGKEEHSNRENIRPGTVMCPIFAKRQQAGIIMQPAK